MVEEVVGGIEQLSKHELSLRRLNVLVARKILGRKLGLNSSAHEDSTRTVVCERDRVVISDAIMGANVRDYVNSDRDRDLHLTSHNEAWTVRVNAATQHEQVASRLIGVEDDVVAAVELEVYEITCAFMRQFS